MDEARLDAALGGLNPDQRGAVDHVIAGWRTSNGSVRLTIIDGPPGTGKTHVAAVTAGQWVRTHGTQVALFTPTHTAAVRARNALLEVGLEPDEVLRLAPGPVGEPEPGVLTFERPEGLPPHLVRQLRQTSVLVTTWHGSQRALGSRMCRVISSGSLVLLDEVSQVPFSAFLALLRRIYAALGRGGIGGVALLGDPHQLPVVTTQDILGTNAALGVLRRHPECTPHRLVRQYRMNTPICEIVNVIRHVAFGGLRLEPANENIASERLDRIAGRYLPGGNPFREILDPGTPVVFVDTTRFSTERHWRETPVGGSWSFEPEAHLAVRLVEAVRQAYKLEPVILSPYRAQAAMLRALGVPNPLTVYRAQGHEWDCVILTLGRTQVTGRTILEEVYQHTYVGLSRPRAKLIVLLHANLFRQFRLFGALLGAAQTIQGVRLVQADPDWGEA